MQGQVSSDNYLFKDTSCYSVQWLWHYKECYVLAMSLKKKKKKKKKRNLVEETVVTPQNVEP